MLFTHLLMVALSFLMGGLATSPALSEAQDRPLVGHRLVFRVNGERGISIMDGNGGGRRKLTSGYSDMSDKRPICSPDGDYVAFSGWRHDDRPGRKELRAQLEKCGNPALNESETRRRCLRLLASHRPVYIVRDDGSHERRLIDHAVGDFWWSKDGRRIFFQSAWTIGNTPIDSPLEAPLFSIHRDGTNLTQLAPLLPFELLAQSGSPDGKQLVFQSARELGGVRSENEPTDTLEHFRLYVINTDGTGERKLTDEPAGLDHFSPSWSPDGGRIAFGAGSLLSGNPQRESIVYLVHPDGTNLEVMPGTRPGDSLSDWSPDGSRLLLNNRDGLTVLHQGTGERSSLGAGARGVFSPDSKWVAFISQRDRTTDLYVASADGLETKRVTNDLRVEMDYS